MAQLLCMVPLALVITILWSCLLIRKCKADAERNHTRKIIRKRLAGIRTENENWHRARILAS